MNIHELIKYQVGQDRFPKAMRPGLKDDITLSATLLERRRIRPSIKYIVTSPSPRRPGRAIVFHTFATNRTAYGAIQDVEPAFAQWFLQTRILPIINPIPFAYFEEAEMLPKEWYDVIVARGIGVFNHAT
jgi:hypothetical protein